MLRDIWKNYNVSLVMVLPIFWRISDNIFSKKENIKYPFPQLVFEYGLLNTFLFKNGKYNNCLYLLFDKNLLTRNKGITRSRYASMLEMLIDSDYYYSCELYNEYVLIGLKIPDKYLPDVDKIINGKYTQTSETYKEELYIKKRMQYLPDSENKNGRYIVLNDLAYAISIRSPHIREELEKVLGNLDRLDVKEYYQNFDKVKENFTPRVVETAGELVKC